MTQPSNQQTETEPKTKPVILSQSPEQALHQIKNMMDELCEYYERENDILEKSKSKTFTDMQHEKMDIANKYQSVMTQLSLRAGDLKDGPAELRDSVKESHQRFLTLARKNKDLLERVQRCTKRVSDRLVSVVKQEIEKRRIHNYSKNGTISKERKRPVSASLHETA